MSKCLLSATSSVAHSLNEQLFGVTPGEPEAPLTILSLLASSSARCDAGRVLTVDGVGGSGQAAARLLMVVRSVVLSVPRTAEDHLAESSFEISHRHGVNNWIHA